MPDFVFIKSYFSLILNNDREFPEHRRRSNIVLNWNYPELESLGIETTNQNCP